MLNFKKLESKHCHLIAPYLKAHNFKTYDYSLGGVMIWAENQNTHFDIFNDTLYLKTSDIDNLDCHAYFMPIKLDGTLGDLNPLIEWHIKNFSCALNLNGVPEEALKKYFLSDGFSFKETPMWSDYLYESEKLAFLQGKLMQKKRNKVNSFKKTYAYEFRKIEDDIVPLCLEFIENYRLKHQISENLEDYELKMNKMAITLRDDLGFIGYVLIVEGKVIAMTFGEVINDTLIVHFEKADIDFNGAYQAINMMFAEKMLEEFKILYINREDDAGDPGLAFAKQSYHPLTKLKKFKVALCVNKFKTRLENKIFNDYLNLEVKNAT